MANKIQLKSLQNTSKKCILWCVTQRQHVLNNSNRAERTHNSSSSSITNLLVVFDKKYNFIFNSFSKSVLILSRLLLIVFFFVIYLRYILLANVAVARQLLTSVYGLCQCGLGCQGASINRIAETVECDWNRRRFIIFDLENSMLDRTSRQRVPCSVC